MTKGILWLTVDPNVPTYFPVKAKHSHVTLMFGAHDEAEVVKRLVGREVEIETVANCHNERIQALSVKLPEGIPCSNKNPHITVSMSEGVKPVESNAMLEDPSTVRTPFISKLKGVIEFSRF